VAGPAGSAPQPPIGFTPARGAAELAAERRFDTRVDRAEMGRWIARLSAHPNHLGSAYDRTNIRFVKSLLDAWGYQTRIERFEVLFATPKTRVLEMIAPRHVRAGLEEAPVASDPVSRQSRERLAPYVAYSIDGDVTAPLVYVNYGRREDYARLAERGVDVRGKIVIARFGEVWRGIKPELAAAQGAVGCILYTDPQDEGYSQGEVYPAGPWRNATMVQRGSVERIALYPGDPLTPGRAAVAGARRAPFATLAQRRHIPVLTTIPTLPISYGDALPLLRALRGPLAPPPMRGTLPLAYHLGPGPALVHLKVAFNWKLTPLYDVIATLRGSERPGELIVRGNHIDSWTSGAMDPHAGTVAELEEARIIAQRARAGTRLKRTLVFAFWDGEEAGFIGSTEWVEAHAAELVRAAVYICTDDTGRGLLSVAGSHALETMFEQLADAVSDPDTGVSVTARQRAHARFAPEDVDVDADGDGVHIGALGAGSDWTAFLDHAGVPSAYIGFNAETLWHSAYDSYAYVTRFSDPGFRYSAAQAQITARMTMRFADADVLPYRFGAFAATMQRYERQVEDLAAATGDAIAARNALIADGAYRSASDAVAAPALPFVAPALEAPPPRLDFAPLRASIARLRAAADAYDRALDAALSSSGEAARSSRRRFAAVDALAMLAERDLLDARGLPGRPWYRHQIYAPGVETGYSAKTLPMIREGIELHHWTAARHGITVVAAALDRYTETLERAAQLLGSGSRER
jgi:N-acetylated-alpha-linked acidic dipeptidase